MTDNGESPASASSNRARPTTSSNRSGATCDATLYCGERSVGGMRLPINRVDDFVDLFNRTYCSIGMRLARHEVNPSVSRPNSTTVPHTNENIPDNNEVAGDARDSD